MREGRVDEVAGDHALALGSDRDRGLAREHAGAGPELLVEAGNSGDEVECGTHGPLRVVLGRRRSAPDGHHSIADELLDGAAVALDDHARDVEVAREELARVLGVPRFGGRREPHQVGEQHRDQSALGSRCGRARACHAGDRSDRHDAIRERARTFVAEPHPGIVDRPARRTGLSEPRSAATAEPRAGLVLGATTRASHYLREPNRVRAIAWSNDPRCAGRRRSPRVRCAGRSRICELRSCAAVDSGAGTP